MNQSHKRSFIAVLIFIGFLLFMAFWGIDLILGAYAGHKLSKLAERHHLDIRYDNIRLIGLSTVRMEGLTVIPIDADTCGQASSETGAWQIIATYPFHRECTSG